MVDMMKKARSSYVHTNMATNYSFRKKKNACVLIYMGKTMLK